MMNAELSLGNNFSAHSVASSFRFILCGLNNKSATAPPDTSPRASGVLAASSVPWHWLLGPLISVFHVHYWTSKTRDANSPSENLGRCDSCGVQSQAVQYQDYQDLQDLP